MRSRRHEMTWPTAGGSVPGAPIETVLARPTLPTCVALSGKPLTGWFVHNRESQDRGRSL
jgi:hypothetical protein